ncbi:MAG: copper resistance protein CopC [Hyphomicrobiales bacterium]|nr:MAG: copper resistance protein CopC [Hyphomicrobiales bacterium]
MHKRATSGSELGAIRALLLVVLFLLGAAPALGHASLIASEPATGTILTTAPDEIVLTFSEAASALAVHLIDVDGTRTALTNDAALADGNRIVVTLPSGLANGTHMLSWRAASSDGHPISGTVIFSIGAPSEAPPAAEPESDAAVRSLLWLSRCIMLATLLLGAGSSGFRMVAAALPLLAGRVAIAALSVGAVATIATFPLHGLDALGRPLADFGVPEVWETTASSAYGASALAALVAMALASVAILARRPNLAGWISLSSLVAIGLTASLSGHASSADPRWLTRSMVFLHVASIAWWAGELLPLALLLRQASATAKPPLLRFSRFIPYVVAPLVVSGVTLTVIQLGPPGPSWWTPYTYLLVAKLLLLVVLFAAAAWNRWFLTVRVVAGEHMAIRHLRASILLEVVLILTIVGVAAGWRFTAPPRAVAAAVASSEIHADLDFDSGQFTGGLSINPARTGPNVLDVALSGKDGEAAPALSIRVFFSKPELTMEKFEIVGVMGATGWHAEDAILPGAGIWIVSVEVRISDFEKAHAKTNVVIAE